MYLENPTSELFVPDGLEASSALARTTHLCVAAHQDDIEIMAMHGILQCFRQQDAWFTGVVVTNGAGSPRDDLYAGTTDAEMQQIRRNEQKKAAVVGEYGAQILLDYSSAAVKNAAHAAVAADLERVLEATRPRVVYTHNLADKHDTHVATTLRLIQAIRRLPRDARPETLYGCEVWRDLDWLADADKVPFDVSAHENLAAALLGVFDSQICGGKRYDLATLGRRKAHATYFASHGVDQASGLTFAMDMTPCITDDTLDPWQFIHARITHFAEEVRQRIHALG